MIIEKLKSFGLTEKEAKVYMAILELGETNVQRISNKSKIKRTTLYDILDLLKEKGLISSTIKNKKKYFIASDPRELESKLEERKTTIKSIIPYLLSITNLIDNKPKIRFFEGDEGIKEIYLDTLKYPDNPIWAWVTEEIWQVIDQDFIDYYLNQRVKKKIWAYVIAPDKEQIQTYKSEDSRFLRQTRIDRGEGFSIQVEIDLYGENKIGVMAFKEKIGLIIESQKIFNTLKSIFDSAWRNLE
ncbi:MAG TPA: helix-turn-helix domain-containing protein [Candidatus Paceibacterota bacterium]|nr:helix-turn-helix domain-containing protein [Candidatus Paceibacterota bacterium]HRZ34467.1 helix-turn-helix domain-containing protein [Candidatus Paceibacterota bacterium]